MWRWARALWIALVIVLGLIAGFPRSDPERVAHAPTAIRWLVERMPRAQSALLAPFHLVTEDCQIGQRWTLFSTIGGIRYRPEIEARNRYGKRWTRLYRVQDPAHVHESAARLSSGFATAGTRIGTASKSSRSSAANAAFSLDSWLHQNLGIAVTMQLGIFPFGMLALYPIFVHLEELLHARESLIKRYCS